MVKLAGETAGAGTRKMRGDKTLCSTVSGGGLYFEDYFEWEGCVKHYLAHPDTADQMGKKRQRIRREQFRLGCHHVEKYRNYFEQLGK